jgi:predicted nucleotidyltransferase
MVRSISEGFRVLRSNLEITDLQEQTVSARQQAIREVLENDFVVKETFLTGSYRRSTMIAPLKDADVDIFVVLDVRYYKHDGKRELFENVKKRSAVPIRKLLTSARMVRRSPSAADCRGHARKTLPMPKRFASSEKKAQRRSILARSHKTLLLRSTPTSIPAC